MRYLYIIFSLLVIDQLYAQDCNYSFFGEVIDLHLNEGLSGAKVTIDNNSFVVSNLKGEFSIEGICEGEHELTISHPNCKVITVNIDIPRIVAKKIYLLCLFLYRTLNPQFAILNNQGIHFDGLSLHLTIFPLFQNYLPQGLLEVHDMRFVLIFLKQHL